ncbi:MAG: DUF86 domain-containing protein [Defluviitaleaceae bacterium]|nr:DUF86 domain-containing protein [Defluviitaleaceae bacterium]
MNKRDIHRIMDIKLYCEEAGATIERFGKDFNIFKNDRDFLKSVSMSVYQIGEMSIRLSGEFKDSTKEKIPWNAMRAMRNLFAHEYSDMRKENIWDVAIKELPKLLLFCDEVIEEAKSKGVIE